jgi:hypothetical membrane protein
VKRIAPNQSRFVCVSLGLIGVGLFSAAFIVCSFLTPGFDPASDYISELGAQGQPFAVWWNAIGFLTVGCILSAFGFTLGRIVDNVGIGRCLTFSGIGFALAAMPTDLLNADASLSKAHFVSICCSLAGWCFAMARFGRLSSDEKGIQRSAGVASVLVVIPLVVCGTGLITMPTTHRFVLGIVFGWIAVTSLCLLSTGQRKRKQATRLQAVCRSGDES